MDLTNFEQFFYRELTVESITTGGNFQLLDITDEEKRRAEEFIHVRLYFLRFTFFNKIKIFREMVLMVWIIIYHND
jgi:hypothetical protein